MRRFLVLLAALVLGLTLTPAAHAQSGEDDVGFITRQLQELLSEAGREVRIRGFRGALSSRATIDEMTILDDDGEWLILRDATMQWNRSALLARRIEIREITARELIILRPPVTDDDTLPAPEARDEPATPFALPELPVSVQLGQLQVDRIELGAPFLGREVALSAAGSASLADGAGQAALRIERIDGAEGEFDLDAAFSNLTRELSLDLTLSEGPDGIAANLLGIPDRPATSLTIAGTGPLDDFAAEIAVGTDGEERIEGSVSLSGDGTETPQVLGIDIAGDLQPFLEADFQPFFGSESRLRTQARRDPDGRMHLEELLVQTELLDLQGSAELAAGGIPEMIDLRGQIASANGERVVLPIGGPRTTIERADLQVSFLAEESEDWELEFDIRDFRRPDITIDRLQTSGIGRISQGDDGALQVVDAVVDYNADGIAPADPALAQAIGTQVTGSTGIIWRVGEPFYIPGLLVEGEDYWAQGEATFDDGLLQLDLQAELSRLNRFSMLAGRDLSGAVAGEVRGTVSPLTGGFDLDTAVIGQNLAIGIEEVDRLLSGRSEIRVEARRGADGITLRHLSANAQTLMAELTGIIRTDGLALEGGLDFADLSVLGDQYGGALDAQVDLRSENGSERLMMTASGQDLAFGIDEADRLLAGRSEIRLDAQRRGEVITINNLTANAQTLLAEVTGTIRGNDLALDGALDFSDLSVLGAQYGGALDATVALRSENGAERLVLDATGRDLSIGQPEADRALRGETALRVNALRRAEVITLDEATVSNAALSAAVQGRIASGASVLDLEFDLPSLGALRPELGGALQGSATLREDGETRRLGLDVTGTGLRAGIAQADGLLAGTTRLTAQVTERSGDIFIEDADLRNPQLNARVSGEASGATRQMRIEARLNDLAQVVPGIGGALQVSGTVRETDSGFNLNLTAGGPAGITLQASGDIGRDLQANLSASGQGDLTVINPQIEPGSIQGPVQFDLRINGPLALESVSGTATVAGASFVQPAAHLRLVDIAARAELRGGRADVDVRGGSARGGRFSVTGFAELTGARRVDMQLALNELGVADPQLFQTTVSGTAAFTGALTGDRLVSGALQLGPTEIRIPSTGLGGPGYVPPNLRHVNDSAAARQTRARAGIMTGETHGRTPRPIRLDLSLDAPNRVFIRGRGLDAELGGGLRLTGTTRDVIPIGQFSLIRGRLDLLGNRFTLTEGFASMQGEFMPFVRLVATTQSDGVTTSIIVEGEAAAPQITFASVPELPEEEVVSRLIFNRDLSSLSVFQAAQLASAVATLTGRGGNGFMERLRSSVGLDDLDITTDEDGNAALRAGRYLTENIYTDVVLDPQGRSEVSVNLDVSPSVTVRGRVDERGRTGVGVFFERDY
ncbi:translocation/assembly module TamB domain-containing protein [Rhodobacteraceae bacterium 2376]|uniref:Translocation/assembly module TamB domain-containing protein n=1 Tax=Rhabdonatronobacter sediminivivens TaxID=2743469 RepID=A0A7Z0KZR6_9RHOB|nr:translocation/assembly module TamB domain-containing protein [Rhabdonatronobacter sediminivivens]NYS24653.1 translocation/assembly module TamB domain-containing protein [Rhabdonatronobacter sediminivivens]